MRCKAAYGGNESVIRTRERCLQTSGNRGIERAHANEAKVKRRDKSTSVSREQTKFVHLTHGLRKALFSMNPRL